MAKKEKQNVFDNDVVETLAFQYRKDGDFTSYRKICEESSNLMDAIIRTNKFDRQVPFEDIKNSLYLQIENWIRKWKPEDGKLYTYFSACSCGHHRLMTDQGVKTIQEIVENKLDVSVLSYDTDKKAFCYNKVTDWSKIPSSRDEWRRVSVKSPDGKYVRLLFTGNHEFYTGDDEWVKLDDSDDNTSHRMYHEDLTDCGKQEVLSVCDTEIRSLAEEPRLNIQLQDYILGPEGDWKQVQYTPDLNWKYDITVENTHCYFVEGVLVHNCIRNGCLSIVGKESLFNQRFAVTDVPLETIMEGYDAPSSDISDVLVETLQKVASEIYCRWEEPVIQEVLRYMVACVLKGRGDRRQAIIETSILGWDINQDTARFLLDWSHGAVRAALLDHYNQPLGTVDVVRAAQKFSLIPDVIDAVGLDNAVKLMNIFAGISIRFPSVQQVRKWQEAVAIYTSLSEDSSQENVKRLGKKYRKSPAKIQEAFENIVTNIKAGVLEDVELYPTVDSLPKMN